MRNTPGRENTRVDLLHEQRLDLGVAVPQRELHLLSAQLRRAGHGADQEGDFQAPR